MVRLIYDSKSKKGDIFYTVEAVYREGHLVLSCSCPPGLKGYLCEHKVLAVSADEKRLSRKMAGEGASAMTAMKALLSVTDLPQKTADFLATQRRVMASDISKEEKRRLLLPEQRALASFFSYAPIIPDKVNKKALAPTQTPAQDPASATGSVLANRRSRHIEDDWPPPPASSQGINLDDIPPWKRTPEMKRLAKALNTEGYSPPETSTEAIGLFASILPMATAFIMYFWVSGMRLINDPMQTMNFLMIATIILTVLFITYEAHIVGAGTGEDKDLRNNKTTAAALFAGGLLLWIVVYPYWMYKRRDYGLKNQLGLSLLSTLALVGTYFYLYNLIQDAIRRVFSSLS